MTPPRDARIRPIDGLLTLVLLAIAFGGTRGAEANQPDARHLDALAGVLLAAGPILLLGRRRHPVAVLLAIHAVTLVYVVADFPRGPVFLSLLIAFVWAMLQGHRTFAWASLAFGWLAYPWVPMLFGDDAPTLQSLLFSAAWFLVIGTTTEVVRVRRERIAEAAHAEDELRRRRASEERLRMAQELHDVLAHNLSLISVQAGVALHLLDERPEHARPALAAIREASGDALGQLRRVLDMLRGDGEAPREPAPSLVDLGTLVERTRSAGLDVRLQVTGASASVPGEVQRAAYRIVQESLTNATRYAAGAPVHVLVDVDADHVAVQVDDEGPGVVNGHSAGSGSGIAGMRERASTLGGTLDAGPRAGGGFRVRAWLPIGGEA